MENKILITSFEPFGGESFNASAAVAEHMPESLAGFYTEKITLPVEFGAGARFAAARARELSVRYIICFGEARARKAVTPELLAINLNYASIPDNAGNMPHDEEIIKGGAAAYFTRFPARRLAEKINEYGVTAALSYSAGAYVCNDLYYRLLDEWNESGVSVIFIHVPRAEAEENYKIMASAIANSLSAVIFEESNG
jgi:pyroglutamyl-peptidase